MKNAAYILIFIITVSTLYGQEMGKAYIYKSPDYRKAEMDYVIAVPSGSFTGNGVIGSFSSTVTYYQQDGSVSQYFGTDSSGSIGFHDVPTTIIYTYSTTYTPVNQTVNNYYDEFTGGDCGVTSATVTLTYTDIQNLSTSPITLVAAPGANKAVDLISAVAKYDYNSTAFLADSVSGVYSPGKIYIYYDTSTEHLVSVQGGYTFMEASSDKIHKFQAYVLSAGTGEVYANKALKIAAQRHYANGDGTLYIYFVYRIVDI